jgi:hypothetical protein
MLGFALQVSHGLFDRRALLAVAVALGIAGLSVAGPRATVVLPFSRGPAVRRGFFLLLLVYLVAGFAFLRYRPSYIDVTYFESDAARSFVRGEDPYRIHFTRWDFNYPSESQYYYGPGFAVDDGVEVGFPYPPLTLLWVLPGHFAGDVRYAFLIAVIVTAFLVFHLAPDLNGFSAGLMFLFVPATLYVLAHGWSEPLVVLALAATIFCAKRFPGSLPLALGLFFASKQYCLLFAPIAALLLPKFSWKDYFWLITKAGAVATITILPFALWGAHGLWRSLVIFQIVAPFRTDALSFSNLLVRHGFPAIPQWGVLLAVVAATWFALKKAPRTPAGFAASVALISLVFFVLNKQAFCNYYFFSAGALCIGLASAERDPSDACFALLRMPQDQLAGAS